VCDVYEDMDMRWLTFPICQSHICDSAAWPPM
jgi:hypothetical protein